jgi:hypothetical protein
MDDDVPARSQDQHSSGAAQAWQAGSARALEVGGADGGSMQQKIQMLLQRNADLLLRL